MRSPGISRPLRLLLPSPPLRLFWGISPAGWMTTLPFWPSVFRRPAGKSAVSGYLLAGLVVRFCARGIRLDGFDPVERRLLALVCLAGCDDLSIGGDQVEVVLAAGPLLQDEL